MPRYTVCVPAMCRHMLRRNFVFNRPPYDLVNVAVKLWSLDLASAQVHVFGPSPSTSGSRPTGACVVEWPLRTHESEAPWYLYYQY